MLLLLVGWLKEGNQPPPARPPAHCTVLPPHLLSVSVIGDSLCIDFGHLCDCFEITPGRMIAPCAALLTNSWFSSELRLAVSLKNMLPVLGPVAAAPPPPTRPKAAAANWALRTKPARTAARSPSPRLSNCSVVRVCSAAAALLTRRRRSALHATAPPLSRSARRGPTLLEDITDVLKKSFDHHISFYDIYRVYPHPCNPFPVYVCS